MGVEYALANRRNRTFYILGKGNWWFLHEDTSLLTIGATDMLAELIANDAFYTGPLTEEALKEHILGCQKIAEELVSLAKDSYDSDLVLLNDTTDDIELIKTVGYRCVGSRYANDEDLENAHLVSSNWNAADFGETRWAFFSSTEVPKITDNS